LTTIKTIDYYTSLAFKLIAAGYLESVEGMFLHVSLFTKYKEMAEFTEEDGKTPS
jgi:hypothetical protein